MKKEKQHKKKSITRFIKVGGFKDVGANLQYKNFSPKEKTKKEKKKKQKKYMKF